ncbi:MAG: carbohydrate kinase [Acidobacteriota bacterium]|nr:carbohydrate kinase [Acidobacteriota bacterium]
MHKTHELKKSASNPVIVALGEVLWDVLPAGERLGGAAANLCVMAGRLGSNAVLASRVGSDEHGTRIVRELAAFPVDTNFVQRDPLLPTGKVTVAIDTEGQPAYCIHENAAWDAFEFSPAWTQLAQDADAVCFGTLAQRSPVSKATLEKFLEMTRKGCLRALDLNLRYPYVNEEAIRWSLTKASLLKVNEEELKTVSELLGLRTRPSKDVWRASVDTLMSAFPLSLVCVTFGSAGSLIVSNHGYYRHPGVATNVVDTVGAGDAFLATVTYLTLAGTSLAEISEAANRNGAWVASQAAAIPNHWPPYSELGAVELQKPIEGRV